MLNNLDRDQHKALPRQRQIQSSASIKECARLKKLLQKPAHHCHCRSRPVGHLRNEHLKNVEERAFVPDNLPISTAPPLRSNSSPISTRRATRILNTLDGIPSLYVPKISSEQFPTRNYLLLQRELSHLGFLLFRLSNLR